MSEPDVAFLCATIRQPDGDRLDAITILSGLWDDGSLTDEEARRAVPALTAAALHYGDVSAMAVLGQWHFQAVSGAADYGASYAWFRRAVQFGASGIMKYAAEAALQIAQQCEGEYDGGPWALTAAGWLALALRFATDTDERQRICRAIDLMQSHFGLTMRDMTEAEALAEQDLQTVN